MKKRKALLVLLAGAMTAGLAAGWQQFFRHFLLPETEAARLLRLRQRKEARRQKVLFII